MIEPLSYSDIAEQLSVIEQHLQAQPISPDPELSRRALDALVCARAVIGELQALAQRHAGKAPTGAATP